jgi:uncharacterized protein
VEATGWYRKAAEQGHAPAHYPLAFRYAYGAGVAEDEAEALEWCSRAAELGLVVPGSPEAQFHLGLGKC